MKQNKVMTVAGWVLTVLITAMLIMSAVMKFAQPEFVVKGFTETSGFPLSTLLPIGIAELVSALLFLFPKTRVLGAVLITGYMGGAIVTHVRQSEPFFVQVLVGVFAWLGLYLRDERIRTLLPIVRATDSRSLN